MIFDRPALRFSNAINVAKRHYLQVPSEHFARAAGETGLIEGRSETRSSPSGRPVANPLVNWESDQKQAKQKPKQLGAERGGIGRQPKTENLEIAVKNSVCHLVQSL